MRIQTGLWASRTAAGKNAWVFGAGQRGAIILVNNDDSE